jgi:hypothetical protein
LKQAYHSEYEGLKRGRLAPIYSRNPDDFEAEFSKELKGYEQVADQHFVRLLKVAARQTERRPFLVFDNADQFSEKTQDEVFRLAQKFAKDLGCASVISLREESYWKNKDHGTLSAFHAVSYHVQPPRLRQVISKRFRFADKLLKEAQKDFVDSDERPLSSDELRGVLEKIGQTLLANDSRYLELLEYLSPFEIRRPLEFLSRFLVSGHTNMDSILRSVRRSQDITIGFHEFFTAIALGDREVYSESASDIVNLFAVDGRADASNLNRLAVLGRTLAAKGNSTPFGNGFLPVVELISDCELLGVFPDTTRSILALFNSKRLVETETQNRSDVGSANLIRATAAAQYYLEKLAHEFAYLDAIVIDTAIGDDDHYQRLRELTEQLESLQAKKGIVRLERLEVRLDRTKHFIKYLQGQYADSTLAKNESILDPAVVRFFDHAEGKLIRQSREILKSADQIFR